MDTILKTRASQVALVVQNPPASAADMRHGFELWVGKIPGGRHENPFQYFCLEKPRGAWWDTVHSVAKSQTLVRNLVHTHTHTHTHTQSGVINQ